MDNVILAADDTHLTGTFLPVVPAGQLRAAKQTRRQKLEQEEMAELLSALAAASEKFGLFKQS